MANHSPRPWKFIRRREIDQPDLVVDAEGFTVCEVWRTHEDTPYEANGNLMAAAPDMLEALENLENDNDHMPATAWQLIQNAIRKAKGE